MKDGFDASSFLIPKAFHDLPLFGGGEGNDVGWMLLDLATYYNELLDKYLQTNDDRYLKVLNAILPNLRRELEDE